MACHFLTRSPTLTPTQDILPAVGKLRVAIPEALMEPAREIWSLMSPLLGITIWSPAGCPTVCFQGITILWASPAGMVRCKRRVEMLTMSIQPKDSVLELGCGVGYFTREIIKTGAFVTAIDISPDLLAIARKNINYKNVSFYEENAYQMAFPNECFDSVIGSSVLHHLHLHHYRSSNKCSG